MQIGQDMSLDRLEGVLRRFQVGVELFHTGPLRGTQSFDARPGRGFLHVLRGGEMDARQALPGHPRTLPLAEPTLLFYPSGAPHRFAPRAGATAPLLTCAAVPFQAGAPTPPVAALPPSC